MLPLSLFHMVLSAVCMCVYWIPLIFHGSARAADIFISSDRWRIRAARNQREIWDWIECVYTFIRHPCQSCGKQKHISLSRSCLFKQATKLVIVFWNPKIQFRVHQPTLHIHNTSIELHKVSGMTEEINFLKQYTITIIIIIDRLVGLWVSEYDYWSCGHGFDSRHFKCGLGLERVHLTTWRQLGSWLTEK